MDPPSIPLLEQAYRDLNATRYISAVGMILMLYDHILTLPIEVEQIWKREHSLTNAPFLFNRYAVAIGQLSVMAATNRYDESPLEKSTCQILITLGFTISWISAACVNLLVIRRVLSLWDNDYRVRIGMGIVFLASYSTSSIFLITIIVESYKTFGYLPLFRTCSSNVDSSRLRAIWASSLSFELFVLLCVVLNALSRPRKDKTPLRWMLYRDGIFIFGCFAMLQSLNLILSMSERISLRTLTVMFVSSMENLILNRTFLLQARNASLDARQHKHNASNASDHSYVRFESVVTDSGPVPFPEYELGRLRLGTPPFRTNVDIRDTPEGLFFNRQSDNAPHHGHDSR